MFLKRVFPYVLSVIAVCTAFFLFSCGSEPQKTVVEMRKTIEEAQAGVVVFPHEVHDKAGVKCVDCHHKKYNDERNKTCASAECHTGEAGLTTMHKLCVDCHLSVRKGPRQCDGCHKELIKGPKKDLANAMGLTKGL